MPTSRLRLIILLGCYDKAPTKAPVTATYVTLHRISWTKRFRVAGRISTYLARSLRDDVSRRC
jgi:hypothetical protein